MTPWILLPSNNLKNKARIKSRVLMFLPPTSSMKQSTVGRDFFLCVGRNVWQLQHKLSIVNINIYIIYNIKYKYKYISQSTKPSWGSEHKSDQKDQFKHHIFPPETSAFRDCRRRRISVLLEHVYISGRFPDFIWKCLPQNRLLPHGLMLCN